MPELPEVETIARQLRALVVDRTISEFESRWVRLPEPGPAEVVSARLRGGRISNVRRRGKFVVFDLDGGEALVVSLRMTGKLLYGVADVDERYVRGEIRFVDGTAMRFSDTRKFGRMAVIDAATLEGTGERRRAKMPLHASLGPEPLARGFTVAWLRALLRRRPRAAIKVLWRARIHPLRKAGTLRTAEVARLHEAIRWALRKGIRLGGASRNDYVDARGNKGRMQREFQVYSRAGEPCPRCGREIVRTVVGGRGTFHCPRCQRAPRLQLARR